MKIVPYSFVILTFLGGWRPIGWTNRLKNKLYAIYTCIMIFIIYTFTLTTFLDLLKPIEDTAEFTNGCFMLLSVCGACTKVTNILRTRDRIIELVDNLGKDLSLPRNIVEKAIQNKFDRLIRRNTYIFAGLVEFATIAVTGNSLLNDLPNRVLPFGAWIPYSLETLPCYLIAYGHQIIANIICANICAANETLVTGLMIQTCAQLKILRCRLENLTNEIKMTRERGKIHEDNIEYENTEAKIFAECIKHHHKIIEFAKSLNDIFNLVMFVQFSTGAIVVCTSLFKLSRLKITSVEFVSMILYLLVVLVQIFIYCWYGNEVMLESIAVGNATYNMDWTLLNVSTKKKMLLLMMRSLRPIKFTSGHVVVLSVESYNSIIKLSYSAYNGLQQSANR